jgi:hypothetical protein
MKFTKNIMGIIATLILVILLTQSRLFDFSFFVLFIIFVGYQIFRRMKRRLQLLCTISSFAGQAAVWLSNRVTPMEKQLLQEK